MQTHREPNPWILLHQTKLNVFDILRSIYSPSCSLEYLRFGMNLVWTMPVQGWRGSSSHSFQHFTFQAAQSAKEMCWWGFNKRKKIQVSCVRQCQCTWSAACLDAFALSLQLSADGAVIWLGRAFLPPSSVCSFGARWLPLKRCCYPWLTGQNIGQKNKTKHGKYGDALYLNYAIMKHPSKWREFWMLRSCIFLFYLNLLCLLVGGLFTL